MHSTSAEASTAAELGLVRSICWTRVTRCPFCGLPFHGTRIPASVKRTKG